MLRRTVSTSAPRAYSTALVGSGPAAFYTAKYSTTTTTTSNSSDRRLTLIGKISTAGSLAGAARHGGAAADAVWPGAERRGA